MKAKEYVKLLSDCQNQEEMLSKVTEVLDMFILEIRSISEIRKVRKSPDAFKSIILELNKKWISLVSLVKKNNINTYDINITNESFYKALSIAIPDTKRLMTNEFKNIIDNEKPSEHPLVLYKVTPLNQITKENINREILCCIGALGNYHNAGLSLECVKPLVNRVSFLRYWSNKGINYDEIKLFENNEEEFLKKYLSTLSDNNTELMYIDTDSKFVKIK